MFETFLIEVGNISTVGEHLRFTEHIATFKQYFWKEK